MDVTKVLGEDVLPFRSRKPAVVQGPAARQREVPRADRRRSSDEGLHTVCQEAACPNIGDCWDRGTATFMILGDTCTRRCGFCNVKTGKPTWNDPLEPLRVARCVARMGLRHAVITSASTATTCPTTARPSGAASSARSACRRRTARSRCLTPDFRGEEMPLAKVIAERPDVFNHNVEVVAAAVPGRPPRLDAGSARCACCATRKEMGGARS